MRWAASTWRSSRSRWSRGDTVVRTSPRMTPISTPTPCSSSGSPNQYLSYSPIATRRSEWRRSTAAARWSGSTTTRPSTRPTRSRSTGSLRAEAPVAWTEAHGGYWVVSDYSGVFDAARDDSTFASGRSEHGGTGLNNVIPKAPVRLHIPVELDLPEHRSYRKVINPLTSPAAVERMQPMIERWTTAFVDDVIEDGGLRPRVGHRRPGRRHDRLARARRRRLAAVLTRPALGAGPPGRQPGARARRRGGHPVDGAHHHRRPSPTAAANPATTSSRSSSRRRSTGSRSPTTPSTRSSSCSSPAASGRRPRSSRRPSSTCTGTPTSGLASPSTPSCSTGPSRSSSASSRRPRRWRARSPMTSTSTGAP